MAYSIDQLSNREQQALALLATGLEYNQIALEMNISINGVRSNIKSVYRKLQVSNSIQAAKCFWIYQYAKRENEGI